MVNECLVFYEGDKGLMTFVNRKVVFQHNGGEGSEAKVGLGIFKPNSLVNKGKYAFAEFENIKTIEPQGYRTVDFYINRGVPKIIEKGKYGENIFFRETYKDNVVIRAYNEESEIVFYENKMKKTKRYTGPNMYYSRINELIEEWEDITGEVQESIQKDIESKITEVDLEDERVEKALKNLDNDKVEVRENGVVLVEGDFESLAIWVNGDDVCMAWLGYIVD